jgi:hypothetical protein
VLFFPVKLAGKKKESTKKRNFYQTKHPLTVDLNENIGNNTFPRPRREEEAYGFIHTYNQAMIVPRISYPIWRFFFF